MEQSLKKQTIKRNILFWGRNAEVMFGMLLLFVAVYSIIFSSMSGDSTDSVWDTACQYMAMCGVLFAYLIPISYDAVYIPLAISFGSKRREAVWGSQLMTLLFIVQIFIIYFLCQQMGNGFYSNEIVVAVFTESMIVAAAFGQIAAAANIKFGTKGMWVTIIVTILFVAVICFCGIGATGWLDSLFENTKWQPGTLFLTVGGIAGVVLYIISLIVMLLTIKKYEVRR